MKVSFSEKIEIPFACSHQYASKGISEKSLKFKEIVVELKKDGFRQGANGEFISVIDRIVDTITGLVPKQDEFGRFLNPKTLLVPIPGHAPFKEPSSAVWPAHRICIGLQHNGLGCDTRTLLRRDTLVKKSSLAESGQRPQPEEHYASLSLIDDRPLTSFESISLIDDVTTRGSTFLGAYARLRDAYPQIPIYCFAAVRTISSGEVDEMICPVTGTISYEGGKLARRP